MGWSVADNVRHNGSQSAPPRHKMCPRFIAQAIGWEGSPKWVFREGMYRLGPYGFPAQILDLPIDAAIELARKCCGQ